jgi:hypothetical protein
VLQAGEVVRGERGGLDRAGGGPGAGAVEEAEVVVQVEVVPPAAGAPAAHGRQVGEAVDGPAPAGQDDDLVANHRRGAVHGLDGGADAAVAGVDQRQEAAPTGDHQGVGGGGQVGLPARGEVGGTTQRSGGVPDLQAARRRDGRAARDGDRAGDGLGERHGFGVQQPVVTAAGPGVGRPDLERPVLVQARGGDGAGGRRGREREREEQHRRVRCTRRAGPRTARAASGAGVRPAIATSRRIGDQIGRAHV